MQTQAHRTSRVRDACLIAAARLDCLVRPCARRLSPRTKGCVALVAMALAVIAYLRGADMQAGFAGGQPLWPPLVTGVTDDERT